MSFLLSQLIAGPATRTPAPRVRDHADQTNHADHTDPVDSGHRPEPSRVWALLEALAYGGAFIDPSGILAAQRLRNARDELRRGHR